MRIVTALMTLALLWVATATLAGPNAGGTLILHAHVELPTCIDTPPCFYIEDSGSTLTDCEAAITSIPGYGTGRTIVAVYAAFPNTGSQRL